LQKLALEGLSSDKVEEIQGEESKRKGSETPANTEKKPAPIASTYDQKKKDGSKGQDKLALQTRSGKGKERTSVDQNRAGKQKLGEVAYTFQSKDVFVYRLKRKERLQQRCLSI